VFVHFIHAIKGWGWVLTALIIFLSQLTFGIRKEARGDDGEFIFKCLSAVLLLFRDVTWHINSLLRCFVGRVYLITYESKKNKQEEFYSIQKSSTTANNSFTTEKLCNCYFKGFILSVPRAPIWIASNRRLSYLFLCSFL